MDADGQMHSVKALIDCGASSFFISPKLVQLLGLQTQSAFTTTRSLDSRILASMQNSQKLLLRLQYLPQLAPVDESDVLVVKMTSYDLVLGIPWFEKNNPDIDWSRKRLIALRNPNPVDLQIAGRYRHPKIPNPVNSGRYLTDPVNSGSGSPANALAGKSSEYESPDTSIEMISATQYERLLGNPKELSEAFAIRLWQGPGLLGGMEHGRELSHNGKYTQVCIAS
jgi:hypothetical protein